MTSASELLADVTYHGGDTESEDSYFEPSTQHSSTSVDTSGSSAQGHSSQVSPSSSMDQHLMPAPSTDKQAKPVKRPQTADELADFNFSKLSTANLRDHARKLFTEMALRGETFNDWSDMSSAERMLYTHDQNIMAKLDRALTASKMPFFRIYDPAVPSELGLPPSDCPANNICAIIRQDLMYTDLMNHALRNEYSALLLAAEHDKAWDWLMQQVALRFTNISTILSINHCCYHQLFDTSRSSTDYGYSSRSN